MLCTGSDDKTRIWPRELLDFKMSSLVSNSLFSFLHVSIFTDSVHLYSASGEPKGRVAATAFLRRRIRNNAPAIASSLCNHWLRRFSRDNIPAQLIETRQQDSAYRLVRMSRLDLWGLRPYRMDMLLADEICQPSCRSVRSWISSRVGHF